MKIKTEIYYIIIPNLSVTKNVYSQCESKAYLFVYSKTEVSTRCMINSQFIFCHHVKYSTRVFWLPRSKNNIPKLKSSIEEKIKIFHLFHILISVYTLNKSFQETIFTFYVIIQDYFVLSTVYIFLTLFDLREHYLTLIFDILDC